MGLVSSIGGAVVDAGSNALRRLGFGGDFGFLSDPAHTSRVLSTADPALEINTPRIGFQFLVVFNMARSPLVNEFINGYFPQSEDLQKVNELVKGVDMPSMNIETEILNQYNKKRISQKKINFNPVTLTMHDVADGKTLRFWEMYYEYYFKDGVNSIQRAGEPADEPTPPEMEKVSSAAFLDELFDGEKTIEEQKAFQSSWSTEKKAREERNKAKQEKYEADVKAARDKNIERDIYTQMKRFPRSGKLFRSEFRDDIVQDRFTGSYGYNLERVGADRYLIDSMDIYQVHGGKYSKVTLIHPRVSSFKQDPVGHEENGLLEITYTLEYEDAVYLNGSREIQAEVIQYFVDEHFMEIEGLAPNDFSVLGAFKDATGIEIGENSVLGNAISSATQGAMIIGDQSLKAASSSVFGGGNIPFPDPSAAVKQIGRNGLTNLKGSLGTSFASGASGAVKSFIPNLRG